MYGLVNTEQPLEKGSIIKLYMGRRKMPCYGYGTQVLIKNPWHFDKNNIYKGGTHYALGRVVGVVGINHKKYVFIEVTTDKKYLESSLEYRTHPISSLNEKEYRIWSSVF